MSPQAMTRHIANLKPSTRRCPKCRQDVAVDRMLTVVDPALSGSGMIWWGCLDCLARADARYSAMQDGEIPQHARALIRHLWHLVTQPHSESEVNAIAPRVADALRAR